jgi:endoglucanase
MKKQLNKTASVISYMLIFSFFFTNVHSQANKLIINQLEYLEMTGLDVMLAHDFYPESHQGGVGIIQNGLRVATNGDLRLEPTPGQWQPVPKVGSRMVDRAKEEISVRMSYPDETKNRKGFNPIMYPDLNFSYVVKIKPEGKSFRIIVDIDQPCPMPGSGKWASTSSSILEYFSENHITWIRIMGSFRDRLMAPCFRTETASSKSSLWHPAKD